MNERRIRFLSVDNVQVIQADTILHEGGMAGVRDRGLLESAVAMPQATYGGEYLHHSIGGMAAAYLYHICQNHAFVDGNKRAAAFSAVLFLALNGAADDKLPPEAELERVTLAVASGEMSKQEVSAWFEGLLSDEEQNG